MHDPMSRDEKKEDASKYKSTKPVVVLFCCACAIFSRDRVLAAEQLVTNVANHVIGLFGTARRKLAEGGTQQEGCAAHDWHVWLGARGRGTANRAGGCGRSSPKLMYRSSTKHMHNLIYQTKLMSRQ